MFEDDENYKYSGGGSIRRLKLHSNSERELVYSVGTEYKVFDGERHAATVKVNAIIERFNLKTNQWEFLITIKKQNNDNYVWTVVRNPITPIIQYEL